MDPPKTISKGADSSRGGSRGEVRILTPSEIESLQRDKAESGKTLLAMFKAHREQKSDT